MKIVEILFEQACVGAWVESAKFYSSSFLSFVFLICHLVMCFQYVCYKIWLSFFDPFSRLQHLDIELNWFVAAFKVGWQIWLLWSNSIGLVDQI